MNLRKVHHVLDDRVKVVEASIGSKDTIHDTGSEDAVTKLRAGDDISIGNDNPRVMELAEDCHGATVDQQGNNVTPGKQG